MKILDQSKLQKLNSVINFITKQKYLNIQDVKQR